MADDAGPIRKLIQPFLLAATIRHHLSLYLEQYPETVALLGRAFYVDDLIVGFPNADKGATVYSETRKILSEASMELHKSASNSDALRKCFLCYKFAIEDGAGDSPVIKVLGVPWEREGYQIIITVREAPELAANKPSTNRMMLQTLAGVYDLWGIQRHASKFRAKLLFQVLLKKKCAWDEALQQEEQTIWNSLSTDLVIMNPGGIVRARVKWKLIAGIAPWWGCSGSASSDLQKKNSFRRSLGRSSLNAESFSTVLWEVEAVINSRPYLSR